MAKKRKIVSKSSESLQPPPQSIEKEQQIIEEDPEEFEGEEDPEELEDDPEEFEGEEVPEDFEGEEDVEYEEYEEELEINEEDGEEESDDGDEEDPDEEPLPSVLAALSKETLMSLLSEAAEHHPDVAARVRESAEADPAQRKIFVHGLRWDTTSENLFEEFLKYGEIDDCRVVTDKATGKSKGYGFILFKSNRGAREALKEPKKTINNRITSCQLASTGGVTEQKLKDPQAVGYESEYTQRKIYVSNVGADLDPKRLSDFFSKYGEIEEGPLGLDKETGKPKGFCLFVYKTIESANRALAEPHKQFGGVTLHCQKAIDGPRFQKKQIIQNLKSHKTVTQNQQFVNNGAPSVVGSTVMPPVMAPLVQQQQPGLSVDPAALGQAITTLIAAQGVGYNLLGALGAVGAGAGMMNNAAIIPSLGSHLVQGGYGNQSVGEISPGLNGIGGYGNQRAYSNQQKGRGGAGRSHRGGRPYRGR